MKKYLLVLLILCTSYIGALTVNPPDWDLGTISYDTGKQALELEIHNDTTAEMKIDFISTCDCLWTDTKTEVEVYEGELDTVNADTDLSSAIKVITGFFQRNMGVMKISLSLLFVVLAGVVFLLWSVYILHIRGSDYEIQHCFGKK